MQPSRSDLDRMFAGTNDIEQMLRIAVSRDIPPHLVLYHWMQKGGKGSGLFITGLRGCRSILDVIVENQEYRAKYAEPFLMYLSKLSRS